MTLGRVLPSSTAACSEQSPAPGVISHTPSPGAWSGPDAVVVTAISSGGVHPANPPATSTAVAQQGPSHQA